MSEHDLKTWPRPFQAVRDGSKSFEFRKNDRGFSVGDTLLLREYDPGTEQYTGEKTLVVVTYILSGGVYRLPEGYVVMSIMKTLLTDKLL